MSTALSYLFSPHYISAYCKACDTHRTVISSSPHLWLCMFLLFLCFTFFIWLSSTQDCDYFSPSDRLSRFLLSTEDCDL